MPSLAKRGKDRPSSHSHPLHFLQQRNPDSLSAVLRHSPYHLVSSIYFPFTSSERYITLRHYTIKTAGIFFHYLTLLLFFLSVWVFLMLFSQWFCNHINDGFSVGLFSRFLSFQCLVRFPTLLCLALHLDFQWLTRSLAPLTSSAPGRLSLTVRLQSLSNCTQSRRTLQLQPVWQAYPPPFRKRCNSPLIHTITIETHSSNVRPVSCIPSSNQFNSYCTHSFSVWPILRILSHKDVCTARFQTPTHSLCQTHLQRHSDKGPIHFERKISMQCKKFYHIIEWRHA